MILYVFVLVYFLLLILLLKYNYKNLTNFFYNTIIGFTHFPSGNKIIFWFHFVIGLFITAIFYYYFNRFYGKSINLSIFLVSIFLTGLIIAIVYFVLTIMYYYLIKRLDKENFLDYYDTEDEDGPDKEKLENMRILLKKEYFNRIKSICSYLMFLQLILFLFPKTIVVNIAPNREKNIPVAATDIVGQAKKKYGADYIRQLYFLKKRYIENFGEKKFFQIFGEQFAVIEPELKAFEMQMNSFSIQKKLILKNKEKLLDKKYYYYEKDTDTYQSIFK